MSGDALVAPQDLDAVAPGRRLSGAQAGAIADRLPEVRHEKRRYPGSTREVFLKGSDRWQASYFAKTRPGAPRTRRRAGRG